MFLYEPIPDNQETIIITAAAHAKNKDALSQGVIVLDRDHALVHSMSGGIGETLAGHAGIRSTHYGNNASRPIIRGLGEDRIRLLNNGLQGIDASTISPDHAPAIDGLEAQSIEVLKGAAALRYGANAVGGVVNIIDGSIFDKLPNKPVSGDIFAGVSDVDDSYSLAAKLNITNGNFVYFLDGLKKQSEDYEIPSFVQSPELRAITGDESRGKVFNSYGENRVLGGGMAYVGNKLKAGINYRNQEAEYGIPNEEAHIKLEQDRYDFYLKYKFEGIIENVDFQITQGDYSHAEIEDTGEIGTVFNVDGYEARIEARQKAIKGIEGLWGLQTSKKDFAANGEEAFILPISGKNWGIFTAQHYENANWGTDFGARFENTKYDGAAGHREFDSTSFALGGFIKPIKGLRLGLDISSTERIPTETELFANGPHAATQSFEIGNESLKTEIAKAIEASIKYKAETYNFELNLWRANFENFIAFNNSGEIDDEELPIYIAEQQDAKLTGFEAQFSQYLGGLKGINFDYDLSYDWVKGEYNNGENIARMPPKQLILGLNSEFNQFNLRTELQQLFKQNTLAQFETATDAATILNLSLTYKPQKFEHLELRLRGQNLLDEEIREHTSVLKDSVPKAGRTIRFGVHYKF